MLTLTLETLTKMQYEFCEYFDDLFQDGIHRLMSTTRQKMKANKGFLAGLDFKQYLDLSSNSFTMNINTENSLNAEPVNAYIYFHTLVSV